MTENKRKIAELNRLYNELFPKIRYLTDLIENSYTEKYELSKKIDIIDRERQVLINHEMVKYYDLK